MGVPLNQAVKVGSYVIKQHLSGRKRYPLVLMLEPLFRCNLACNGCGKIDYPSDILNQRLTVDADPDMPLLYALRNDIGLNNPHFGCGLAQCGACTVLVDGKATRSCVIPPKG